MRPVIEKKKFELRHIAYIIMIGGFVRTDACDMQFFQDEKLGVIFGISKEKEDKELKDLQDNFINIFNNSLDIIEDFPGNTKKIKEEEELVVNAVKTQEQKENYSIDINIPYFNIKSENAVKINQSIKNTFVCVSCN